MSSINGSVSTIVIWCWHNRYCIIHWILVSMKFSFTYKEGVILQIRDILLGPTRITRCILNTSDDNDPFHRVVGVDRKVCVCVVFFSFYFWGGKLWEWIGKYGARCGSGPESGVGLSSLLLYLLTTEHFFPSCPNSSNILWTRPFRSVGGGICPPAPIPYLWSFVFCSVDMSLLINIFRHEHGKQLIKTNYWSVTKY